MCWNLGKYKLGGLLVAHPMNRKFYIPGFVSGK